MDGRGRVCRIDCRLLPADVAIGDLRVDDCGRHRSLPRDAGDHGLASREQEAPLHCRIGVRRRCRRRDDLCRWRRSDPRRLGKDSTLTGRTYLWQQGIEAAKASPLVGVGYQAYWVQGFSEAERLWEEFYIGSRAGFHFHNTFIEAVVETGLIGLILLTMVWSQRSSDS